MHEMGYSALGISLPVFVAQQEGLFAEHGVPVRLRGFPTAHPLVEAIMHDRTPRTGGFVAHPIAFHRHINVRPFFYACAVVEDRENPISFLLVRNGSGIETIADLGNRDIGVLPTKAYREWLKLLGKRDGLGYHQMQLDSTCKCMQTGGECGTGVPTMRVFDVEPKDTVEALRSGRVDAVFTNDPGASAALEAGVAEVYGDEPILPALLGSPWYFGSFLLDSELVDAEPDTARRIVSALDDAIRFVRAHPDRARRHAEPFMPEECSNLRDPVGRPRFLTSDEVDAVAMQAMADSLAEHGVVRKRIEMAPYILRADAASRGRPRSADARAMPT